jgi:hypothetical protein
MRNSKRISVLAGGTAALIGVGVAFAAWTSTGSDDGAVSSISDAGLTVTAADSVTGLFPTGTQTISVNVENKNPYKVALTSIDVGTITASKSGCNVEAVTAPDNDAPATTLGAKDTATDSANFNFVVSMSDMANDYCQNSTFKVPFTANGLSSN